MAPGWPAGDASVVRASLAVAAVGAAAVILHRAHHYRKYARFYGLPSPAGEQFALGHMLTLLSRWSANLKVFSWPPQTPSAPLAA